MKFALIAAIVLIVAIAVGLAVLGSIDMPAPSGQVQKTIPADRLPH